MEAYGRNAATGVCANRLERQGDTVTPLPEKHTADASTPPLDAPADATVDEVVATALRMFADAGFHATKLEDIAKASGMSKRKIHYNFGDKKGLYARAVLRALEQLRPPESVLNRSYAVPVEGMRRFIDALYMAIKDNPDAVVILLREQLDPALEDADSLFSQRPEDVALHLERLLLIGQDSGAFRPGISADDVLLLLISLCFFPAGVGDVAQGLRGVDFRSDRNITGMRRMVIDTVIAFLTTSISPSGYDSYLEATPPTPAEDSSDNHDYLSEPEGGIY